MVNSSEAAGLRLDVRGIGKAFHGNPALIDVDLQLHGGEMLALVGANGAGKTTLIKIICGALTRDNGEILVDGKQVSLGSVKEAQAAGIAVAHQQIAVISSLTAAENIMLGREPLSAGFIRNSELYKQAAEIVSRFGVDIDLDRESSELGLGENKILDILKALTTNPSILILDEPTASLTLAESQKLFAFLRDCKAAGLAILYISHHLDEIFAQCDRVVVLKDGRKVHDGPTVDTTPAAVVRLMVGRSIEDSVWASAADHGSECLHITDAQIGKLKVPDLVVHKGEVVGLAGVLGAGQTEILEAIAGAGPKPAGGQFLVNGKPGCPHSVTEAIDRGVYLVSDDRLRKALFPGLTVEENLLSASLGRTSRLGFMQAKRGAEAGKSTIKRLSIKCDSADQDVFQLSGGNQQKVTFGRWLIRLATHGDGVRPLVLLDNPTEGVDVGSKAEIYDLVRELTRTGASVLVSSAEFPEMLKLCDRIYCIADHSVGVCLDRSQFSEERLLLQVN